MKNSWDFIKKPVALRGEASPLNAAGDILVLVLVPVPVLVPVLLVVGDADVVMVGVESRLVKVEA